MEPDARVWRVYNDEADNYDKEMLDGWHETLNVLLTFARISCAVQTMRLTAYFRPVSSLLSSPHSWSLAISVSSQIILN
jgi:hypothetical protein